MNCFVAVASRPDFRSVRAAFCASGPPFGTVRAEKSAGNAQKGSVNLCDVTRMKYP